MARVLDVPYTELTEFTQKPVMNVSALVIPSTQPGDMAKQPATGTYQDALLGTYAVPTSGPRLKCATEGLERVSFHDSSFATWDVRPVARQTSFDDALTMIAKWNNTLGAALRFRIKFEDGTEISFRRTRPRDASSLTYNGTYDPSGVFQSKTLPKKATLRESLQKSLQFMADPRGHVLPKHARTALNVGKGTSSSSPKMAKAGSPSSMLHSSGAPSVKALTFPSASERAALFRQLDPNGNGLLSLAELDKAVVELWPQFNSKPAILRAYKAADKNGTGWLGKKEFRYFLRYITEYVNLWHLFTATDTSGDRRISFAEFQAAQRKILGLNLAENAVRVAFSTMDRNGGGYVLFDEFCSWIAAVKTDAVEAKDTSTI